MTSGTLRVLTYHRIVAPDAPDAPNPSLVSATPRAFAEQMRYLAQRFRVVSVDEVLAAYRGEHRLPERAVLITFDDAYRDVGEVAWPILRGLGLPAAIFVPTACTGGRCTLWWDRLHQAIADTSHRTIEVPSAGLLPLHDAASRLSTLRLLQRQVKTMPHVEAMALVDRLCAELGLREARPSDILGWEELRELSRDGMTIGAHTRTHPALTRLPLHEARAEIRGSCDDVMREIGSVPPIFAYPFGSYDDAVVAAVRDAGVELAVTCLDGHNRVPDQDPLRLCRTNVTPRSTPAIFRFRLSRVGARVDRIRHRNDSSPRRWVHAAHAVPREPATSKLASPRLTNDAFTPTTGRPARIAYLVSRFPKLTETFVLYELLALEEMGVAVELYPLLRERQAVAHPEAVRWTARAHFLPFVSLPILRAQLYFLRRSPRTYFALLFEVLRRTWGSMNFFVGALGCFPKSVRFAYEMERAGVTHVHAHFCTHPALAAFVIHRLTGLPYSFTAHGSDLHVDRRMLDVKVDAAAFVVAISRFNKRVITDSCGESAAAKVHVIHCGVDVDAFSNRPAERTDGPVRILCVASFEEVKGHRHLLDACALLHERGLDFTCDLVGEGPLRGEMEKRIAQLALGSRVRLLGGLARPQVIQAFRSADIAVLASQPTREGKREGIPVVLMEAMASALPVVSTAISGIPELVDHGCTGLLVPPAAATSLADALERLARDPGSRRRMGEAGRRKVEREFDQRANAAALLELFERQAGVSSRSHVPRHAAWYGVPASHRVPDVPSGRASAVYGSGNIIVPPRYPSADDSAARWPSITRSQEQR